MSICEILEDIKANVDAILVDKQSRRVLAMHELANREPRHGCEGKASLGRNFVRQADRISRKRGKKYGVYRCDFCGGLHLTTKLDHQEIYLDPLLYITKD